MKDDGFLSHYHQFNKKENTVEKKSKINEKNILLLTLNERNFFRRKKN